MTAKIVPFSLKDAPSLIEHVLPSQKLSAESYKEQMAVQGKTLTALGSYWKGRKPLILNRACVLGALLPLTSHGLQRDLEVFEMLMGMDEESFVARWKRRPRPSELVSSLPIQNIGDYFLVEPSGVLPTTSPIDLSAPQYSSVKIDWRDDIGEMNRRRLEAQLLPAVSYRERVELARRPEEVDNSVHKHIWDSVNRHLGTTASSMPELVEQLGVMRFGHRPRVGDTFCGSGQIPFEAARLGCDSYASDLNPIACMLTWGAFHIVGGPEGERNELVKAQNELVTRVRSEIDKLGVESDGAGWRAKVFLYCTEVECPECGWKVPLLPSRIIHIGQKVIAELVPDKRQKIYRIQISSGVDKKHFGAAEKGTVEREGKYGEAYLVHQVDGSEHRVKISTLRGDFQRSDGTIGNRLRQWETTDFKPLETDIFQERLYCVQWIRRKPDGRGEEYEFRSVTDADLRRESVVYNYVRKHLAEWQSSGVAPDSRIEVGGPPRYQGLDLIRARGWTHWHHVFSPRQLLVAALVNKYSDAKLKFGLTQLLNSSSKLSRWLPESAGQVKGTFDNQALNTIFNYGCRSAGFAADILTMPYKSFDCGGVDRTVTNGPADKATVACDVFITDPPYGDAVKYEEILDFFISWLRKRPPVDFAHWIWDSRRALAIKGEDDDFRRGMVAAYKRMTELMPDNGLQIVMFTHQSGSIWADMANIVWASGLHVTAAWYVVTETDSALREGSHVKGTVLLVLRKRLGDLKTGRDDLAWEIQEEVQTQVDTLTGLNQSLVGSSRAPNQFSDADLQMAGYAAALRVLTRYSIIDGRQMAEEALRPRQRGTPTMVDELIEFAVGVANNCLVPSGLTKPVWDKLRPVERFYLKLLELERRGFKTLDNYQNFAKAFKVAEFKTLMASQKANSARLKSAEEFGRAEMAGESELANTPLRGVLYALMELQKDVDGDEVLQHLSFNVEDYFSKRPMLVELCGFLAKQLTGLREDEASAARVLHDLIENQRL